MKVVLFCGGLGTRIREYSESIPKPMIPVGHQPILWHVMQYYSEYGHTDFVLTLGYKANIIKEFFLSYRPQVYADCVVSGFGANVELLGGEPEQDWRVTLIDTGIWRNIGERLWAVRDQVKDEEIFLANYADGLTDVDLDDMVERFRQARLLPRRPAAAHLPSRGHRRGRPGPRVPLVRPLGHVDQRRLLPAAPPDLRPHERW
jgi:glucose-1-phosphate cytidylyltransferase